MIKSTLTALAVAVVIVQVSGMTGDEYLQDEEILIGRLDFARLSYVSKSTSDPTERCNNYEQDLREMLDGVNRDSMSRQRLYEKVAAVISNKSPTAHANIVNDLTTCIGLVKDGHFVTDNSYAPSRFSAPSSVDETVVMSRIDFGGLASIAHTLNRNSTISTRKEEKCYTLEEELREMLGDISEGKDQEELFTGVLCSIDTRGHQNNDAMLVWSMLSGCTRVQKNDYSDSGDCWA